MLRRSILKSAPVVLGAPLIGGAPLLVPTTTLAATGKDGGYSYGFKLEDVTGKAKIVIKTSYAPYYAKVYRKVPFEGTIWVDRFKCLEKGLLKIDGRISADFPYEVEKDAGYELDLVKEPFYDVYAELYKDVEDKYDPASAYHPKKPPKDDDDKDDDKKKLIIDIGKIIIVKKVVDHKYGKLVIKYVLDPDEKEITKDDVGRDVFKELKKCAKRVDDDDDDYDDGKGGHGKD